ncbi:MAG: response regulator transcription factor [Gemmatimonadota bacterium]
MPDTIRVLLVDDHIVLRAGLRALLEGEEDIVVVGEASTGEEGVEAVKRVRPDVVVMDLTMPGAGGLEALRQMKAMDLPTRVLILTMHSEDEYLLAVLEAGGSGYVRKTSADHDLTAAIRTVAKDEVYLYPSAAKLLLQGFRLKVDEKETDPMNRLSARERDVLQMTAEGFSSTEIGAKLFISPKTVDTYRARVMEKLGLNHRSELVRMAVKAGMLHA